MSVMLAARDGLEGRRLAQTLAEERLIQAVLFETGRPALRRKLIRHFSCAPWFWPSRFLDLVALKLMSAGVQAYMQKHLPSGGRDLPIPVYGCADINNSTAAEVFQRVRPDLVVIFGTALLGKKTLGRAPLFLNLHGGVVPRYRNVHSEFWALKHGVPQEIGSSVLRVTPGIDDGEIVGQGTVSADGLNSLGEARLRNFQLGTDLLKNAIREWLAGRLTSRPQPGTAARHLTTPGWRQIWF